MSDRFADYTTAHWSCLFYLEGRVVAHRGMVPIYGPDLMSDPEWNASVDLIKDKLIEGAGSPLIPFELTDEGWDVAHALRRLRATGPETNATAAATRRWVLAHMECNAGRCGRTSMETTP